MLAALVLGVLMTMALAPSGLAGRVLRRLLVELPGAALTRVRRAA
jgi:hypothetical protein